MSAFVAKLQPATLPSPVERQIEVAQIASSLLTRGGVFVIGVQLDAFNQDPTIFVLPSEKCARMFPAAVRTVEQRADGSKDVFWAARIGNCRVQWRM